MKTERTNLAKKQIDLIKESICVEIQCTECRNLMEMGGLCFAVMESFVDDRGKSCLFRLKEMCHELFRESEEANYKEKLYDITVGYIFHEAMKLRENLYQLEYYKPQYDVALNNLTDQEKKTLHEMEMLIKRTEKRLREGLKEIMILLKQLVGQLKDLMQLYKDNYLMPRFILENEKSLIRIYGKKSFHELIDTMYENGREALLWRAAESYLGSEYYERARGLFQKVLNVRPGESRALFLHAYASAFYFYYKNRYKRAHSFAEMAYAVAADGPEVTGMKRSLKHLLEEIAREVRRTRN
jgi:tetratricopeptide (TPR) repeat protein